MGEIMISRVLAFAALSAGLLAPLAPVAFAKEERVRNRDCYFQGQTVARDCKTCKWYALGIDPDRFSIPLNRTSINHYEYADEGRKISAFTELNREAKSARIVMNTPDAKSDETVALTPYKYNEHVLDGIVYADSIDESKMRAHQYRLFCSFGLTDVINENRDKEEKEMDRLGPPKEWSDPNAASVGALPVGTVLEVTRDFSAEVGHNVIVEYNGEMGESAFDKIELQYRFAFIKFSNANNGYNEKTPYAKGIKMRVTSVEYRPYVGDEKGGEYRIGLEPVSEGPRASQPITYMIAIGRRAGRSEMKLPQFTEILKPIMSVKIP